jgi:flagellar biogenesis protein FliO
MQVALTIAVLVLAFAYVVKRFFLRKKSSCSNCKTHS